MNEKYKGDALLQKGYTEDYLTKKRARNLGDKEKYQKYYIKEDHEPIIPPSVFDTVQAEIAARSGSERYSGMSIFSSKLQGYHGVLGTGLGRDGGENDGGARRGDRIFLHRREQGQGMKKTLRKLGWFLRRFCCSNSMFRKKLDSIFPYT